MAATSQATSAYERLRGLLMAGDFRPGEPLAEVVLANRLGMSRTPVREALRQLQADGLVADSWRGVRVAELSPVEIGHAYEARAALEALTGEAAAQRVAGGLVPTADLRSLRELAERCDRRTQDGALAEAVELNRAFHRAIADLAANPIVAGMLGRLWDLLHISTRASLTDQYRQDVGPAHERLLEAIEQGRGEDAGHAAREHVLSTLAALDAAGGWTD